MFISFGLWMLLWAHLCVLTIQTMWKNFNMDIIKIGVKICMSTATNMLVSRNENFFLSEAFINWEISIWILFSMSSWVVIQDNVFDSDSSPLTRDDDKSWKLEYLCFMENWSCSFWVPMLSWTTVKFQAGHVTRSAEKVHPSPDFSQLAIEDQSSTVIG